MKIVTKTGTLYPRSMGQVQDICTTVRRMGFSIKNNLDEEEIKLGGKLTSDDALFLQNIHHWLSAKCPRNKPSRIHYLSGERNCLPKLKRK